MAQNSELKSTMNELFRSMDGFMNSKSVIGEPIHVDGATILPIVDVSFGCGAGSSARDRKDGAMGGLTGKVGASAVLVIENGTVRLLNVKNQDTITKIIDTVPGILDHINAKKNSTVKDADVIRAVKEEEK
ncbi:MAG: GerW family sporulation protein [Lachnospiraceae bacterium]|nr:GerW family sporulation protein [Lachnospiraceae bacterium]